METGPLEGGPTPLGEALAAETSRRELTHEAAAALCKTSQQTFGKWMRGEIRRPSDSAMPHIAAYLRIPAAEAEDLRRRGTPRRDPLARQVARERIESVERDVISLRGEIGELSSQLEAILRQLPPAD